MPPMVSGWLTLRSYSSVSASGLGLVVRWATNLRAIPARGPVGEPLDVEVVDAEGERLHHVGVEQAAGGEVVVLGQVVGEAVLLADEHDDAALVAEQAADGEADQHHEHGQVEEQVAGLAQVAALGRDGVAALGAARRGTGGGGSTERGPREHDVGRLVGGVRRVLGQPGQVARVPRGGLARIARQ